MADNLLDILAKMYVQPQAAEGQPQQQVAQGGDRCGPEPPRPNYYSPQATRDAYYSWQMCKMGG